VRLLYENLLWLAALKERGIEFVEDMRQDEAFNRKALGQLILRNSTHGRGVTGSEALNIRSILKDLSQQFPKPKKLNAAKTSVDGGVEPAYCDYIRLSLDAVHCSMMTLGYHLTGERTQEKTELVLSVVPRTTPAEELSTVLDACRALLRTARGVDDFIGCTTAGATLAALEAEFVSTGWLERCLRPVSTTRSCRAGSTRSPPGPH
jgi:hypothetical protein